MTHLCKSILVGIAITASVFVISSCNQEPISSPVFPPPVTWTPTVPPDSSILTPEKPLALATALQPKAAVSPSNETADPTATPVQSDLVATVAPTSTPIPQAAQVTATPIPAPVTSKGGRIDEAGPEAVQTVEPLAIGAGMPPTRLLIPVLGLDTPVQAMGWKVIEDAKGVRSEWEVVDFAAGHHINSAFPGEAGNVVLSGHNNIGGAVFQSVCVIGEPGVDFGLGDEMILEDYSGRRFIYQINGWRRLEEANASIAQRQENAQYLNPTTLPQLTLVTCWPPNSNTHRVVVTGLLSGME